MEVASNAGIIEYTPILNPMEQFPWKVKDKDTIKIEIFTQEEVVLIRYIHFGKF